MLYSKILIPYNNTDLSNKALETVKNFAKVNPNTEIDLLFADQVPIPTYPGGVMIQESQDKFNDYADETLENAVNYLADLQNPIHKYIVDSQPITAILNHVETNKNDLIIMGNRGLRGIKEFLESVSHVVVQKSPIPVLLVK
ncbi:universal stress protein [Heyndrickxia oleronia]|jgi:nucleotide-binding universal stress UspA family protein|uniref:universal stress protein n=1 Tax=Heyndrickxia oleronia TaxID=38875 RepID=UPI002431C122|nr:universal stress protein [Heyndrickxia oleronia]MCI1590002.1 universal stress protein [Heyndrickxia oleronia]MCI1613372.1 universal stress protein [Heyndrickxia oleronia]MCI1744720.1 universal stress protein [Heyndrickxia oleronia]MCI1761321.1 universal stress protein [Heyndrickxia oleronia]